MPLTLRHGSIQSGDVRQLQLLEVRLAEAGRGTQPRPCLPQSFPGASPDSAPFTAATISPISNSSIASAVGGVAQLRDPS